MNNKQTRTTTAPRMIVTAMVFLTTRSSATVFTLLALASPFLHLFADSAQKGVFGWAYMSSFLNALGWALLPLFLGMSMLLEVDNKKGFQIAYRIRAFATIAIGIFYMVYTVIPMQDFTKPQYYVMVSLIAVLGTGFVWFITKAIKSTEKNLKSIIKKLFRYILQTTPQKYISPQQAPEYDRDAINLIHEVSNEC